MWCWQSSHHRASVQLRGKHVPLTWKNKQYDKPPNKKWKQIDLAVKALSTNHKVIRRPMRRNNCRTSARHVLPTQWHVLSDLHTTLSPSHSFRSHPPHSSTPCTTHTLYLYLAASMQPLSKQGQRLQKKSALISGEWLCTRPPGAMIYDLKSGMGME